jgi:hypothetical protein
MDNHYEQQGNGSGTGLDIGIPQFMGSVGHNAPMHTIEENDASDPKPTSTKALLELLKMTELPPHMKFASDAQTATVSSPVPIAGKHTRMEYEPIDNDNVNYFDTSAPNDSRSSIDSYSISSFRIENNQDHHGSLDFISLHSKSCPY